MKTALQRTNYIVFVYMIIFGIAVVRCRESAKKPLVIQENKPLVFTPKEDLQTSLNSGGVKESTRVIHLENRYVSCRKKESIYEIKYQHTGNDRYSLLSHKYADSAVFYAKEVSRLTH